jgi:hypothetical protein
MHRILGRSSGNIAEFELSEALSPEDYAALVRKIEALIEAHGKSHLLWDLTGLEQSDFNALWDEATFAVDHAGEVKRIALVASDEWGEWSDRVLDPFENAEVCRFSDPEQAMRWLME